MLRSTIRSSCHSFTAASLASREGPETASQLVHLRFEIKFRSVLTSGEGGREEGTTDPGAAVHDVLHSLTSSFVAKRSSLETREQIAEKIDQHFSNLEAEWLLLPVDDLSGKLFDLMIQQRARLTLLSPEESLMIVSSTTVTYHVQFNEEHKLRRLAGDLEGSTDSQIPASRVSVDGLERKEVEEQEESTQKTCVVCQDELGVKDKEEATFKL